MGQGEQSKSGNNETQEGGVKKAHPVGEIHFHGKDTDILRTNIGGAIDVDTVSEDTVNGGHDCCEGEGRR